MSGKRGAGRWLKGHLEDAYVREANARGYRSRAAFKLMQIDDQDRLLFPGARVVELGAAPGGWTQVALERVGERGQVLALDRAPMPALPGARVLQGDFMDPGVRDQVREQLGGRAADLVISDMAPNLSGVKDADQARAAELAVAALDFAAGVLGARGAVLVKLFHGSGSAGVVEHARQRFARVAIRKPRASRSRSAETYLIGRGPMVYSDPDDRF